MKLFYFLKRTYSNYLRKKQKRQFNKNKELKNLVSKNIELKDIHKGKRCFVLGNGPSLNDEELALLKNEYVFTVNKISKHPQFKDLKTNYHFWADPVFFKNLSPDNEEDKDLIKSFLAIKTEDNSPICFLPTYAKKMVEDFNIDKELQVKYYYPSLQFRDDETEEIDFASLAYNFATVVQWAVAMAIYMGFSEIYLLGCDMTYIVGQIQTMLNENNDYYAYKVNDAEKNFVKNKIINTMGMESQFKSAAKMLHLYQELKKYCDKRQIKLVNLSSKTIIDSLPRDRLTNVLQNKEN